MIRASDILATDNFRAMHAIQRHTVEWRTFVDRVRRAKGDACQACKAGQALQVHHPFYLPDRMLWQYEIDEVQLLCDRHHAESHAELERFKRYVYPHLLPRELATLNGALAVGLGHCEPMTVAHAVAGLMASPGAIVRFAKDFAP